MALENDASCVEALYNAGLCNKKLGLYEEALEDFFKLHSIVRNHSEVVYQIASLYEAMGDVDQAIEWYEEYYLFLIISQFFFTLLVYYFKVHAIIEFDSY